LNRAVPAESIGRTMMVAVAVALLCSALVSGAVYVLRPLQAAYALLERNQAILAASGRVSLDATDKAIVDAFLSLDARGVDLATATFSGLLDGHAYDHWDPIGEVELLPPPIGVESVGLSEIPRFVPVYIARPPGAERIVLPLHGQGMWSTLYGYLALEDDLRTVASLVVYKHGETPGIGDRIEDPKWLASWHGKQLFDEAWQPRLEVGGDQRISTHYQVDAISGATVTSQALGRIVRFWATVYAPLLSQMEDIQNPGNNRSSQGVER